MCNRFEQVQSILEPVWGLYKLPVMAIDCVVACILRCISSCRSCRSSQSDRSSAGL